MIKFETFEQAFQAAAIANIIVHTPKRKHIVKKVIYFKNGDNDAPVQCYTVVLR